jgi:hypothetical protein
LEDPISLARLEQSLTALAELRGTVVIDEVQRRPELFPLLRVLADRTETPARFLILGSASPALLRQSSESLAGQMEIVEMAGFDLSVLGLEVADALWVRGGFPRAFLAGSEGDCRSWRRDFIRTLLEGVFMVRLLQIGDRDAWISTAERLDAPGAAGSGSRSSARGDLGRSGLSAQRTDAGGVAGGGVSGRLMPHFFSEPWQPSACGA